MADHPAEIAVRALETVGEAVDEPQKAGDPPLHTGHHETVVGVHHGLHKPVGFSVPHVGTISLGGSEGLDPGGVDLGHHAAEAVVVHILPGARDPGADGLSNGRAGGTAAGGGRIYIRDVAYAVRRFPVSGHAKAGNEQVIAVGAAGKDQAISLDAL